MDRGWTVEDHLAGKDPVVIELYEQFVGLIRACGSFEFSIAKTAISFKGNRRGFAGAVLGARSLGGHLDLQRRIEGDPRIRRSAPYTKRLFVHHFRVTSPGDLDDTFRGWVEAYAVGNGAHLRR